MKQLMHPLIYFLLCLILISSSCKKDKEKDPFASLNNSATCKINGQTWKSTQKGGGVYDLSPFVNRKYLYLGFSNGREELNIFINPPYNNSSFIFNKTTIEFPTNSFPENYISFRQSFPDLTPEKLFITNNIDNGSIEFTKFDTITKKIKARFSFTGKDRRTGQKITITDGYFEYHQ